MSSDSELGIVGLGSMGENLARQALEDDVDVVGVNPSDRPELEEMGATVLDAGEYGQLAEALEQPRVVLLAVHAGEMVDDELDGLLEHLEEGDVVMDAGNSFWRDSIRRERRAREQGVYFLDVGASGGPEGAREGACFVVGGRREGFERAEPILDALSVEGGLLRVGEPGSGHFVKLVHNGVDFGMLQSIAEGVELLRRLEPVHQPTDVLVLVHARMTTAVFVIAPGRTRLTSFSGERRDSLAGSRFSPKIYVAESPTHVAERVVSRTTGTSSDLARV